MSELKNLKKVKSFDISEFDGIKTKIEEVILQEVESKDWGEGVKEQRQIKVSTAKIGGTDEKPIKVNEWISLKKDSETGLWGIPENDNSKAMKFLKFFKVNDFEELIGKEATIVRRISGDKEFLGIYHG